MTHDQYNVLLLCRDLVQEAFESALSALGGIQRGLVVTAPEEIAWRGVLLIGFRGRGYSAECHEDKDCMGRSTSTQS